MIPQYSNLLYIKTLELATFKDLVTDPRWLVYIPSFQDLILPDMIEKYGKDYNYEWTEVMFNYITDDGPDLLILYDFQDTCWYVKDFTYNPSQEYRLKSLKQYLLSMFDSKQDPVLNSNINFFSKEDTSGYFKSIIPEYLKWHKDMINKYIKD